MRARARVRRHGPAPARPSADVYPSAPPQVNPIVHERRGIVGFSKTRRRDMSGEWALGRTGHALGASTEPHLAVVRGNDIKHQTAIAPQATPDAPMLGSGPARQSAAAQQPTQPPPAPGRRPAAALVRPSSASSLPISRRELTSATKLKPRAQLLAGPKVAGSCS